MSSKEFISEWMFVEVEAIINIYAALFQLSKKVLKCMLSLMNTDFPI